MNKIIGVVGGIGSYAGIDLIKKIYDHSEATTDQEYPSVAMLSLPHKVLDRTEYLLGEINENPGEAIGEIINTLLLSGAEVIGIPCNSAHAPEIFEAVKKSIKGDCRLLHLVEEVGAFIKEKHSDITKVGVLGTTGTFRTNLYGAVLASFGLGVVYPTEEIQTKLVHPAIYDPAYGIKAFSNPVQEKAREDLMTAASYLCQQGAEAIVLGCTEIALAIDQEKIGNSIAIDSTSVLARALLRESMSA